MSGAPSHGPALLTAEEFAERADPGYPEELVRGRLVAMPLPKPRHGELCARASYFLMRFLEEHKIGRVLSNDSGVVTERGPDTVRGADVAFYSFAKLPEGKLPDHYPDVPPDLVVEVLSPSDRWPRVLLKVGEYLAAGVPIVIVLDDERMTAHVFRAEQAPALIGDGELTIPDVLPGFAVPVRRFFE
jgi:Uma2 family endonuclease